MKLNADHLKSSSNGGGTTKTRHQSHNKPFEGSHADLKGYYYTHSPDQQAVDQCQQTTEKITELVCSQFHEPQMLKLRIKDKQKHTLPEPTLGATGPKDDKGNHTTQTHQRIQELADAHAQSARKS